MIIISFNPGYWLVPSGCNNHMITLLELGEYSCSSGTQVALFISQGGYAFVRQIVFMLVGLLDRQA